MLRNINVRGGESIKLYVIGNGFDLHHGLRTSYWHYYDYLRKHYPTIVKEYERFPYLSYSDSPWSDIESALSIDYEELLSDTVQYHYPNIMSDSDSRWSDIDVEIDVMTDFISAFTGDCFFDWLLKLDFSNSHADMVFSDKSYFINFNYTDTLHRLYSIPKERVLHIHGALSEVQINDCFGQDIFPSADIETIEAMGPLLDKSKWNCDIIRNIIQFGASDINADIVRADLEKIYSNDEFYTVSIEPAIRTIENFILKTTKNISKNYEAMQSFISGKYFDEVIIMGASLGSNDDPYYIDILVPALSDRKWVFMLFNDKDGINAKRINDFINRVGLKTFEIIEW